jgi:dTDP-glucose pyrophosphorylase/mevalonate kinase
MGEIELFVPGRLCLFGEHSDWAGGHRWQNSKIGKGYTIVAPTNQGTYARIKKLEEPIIRFKSTLTKEILEVKLDKEDLLKIAESNGLFSYVAGVAHELIGSYKQCSRHGIEIDNYKTDLPIKKGLSSSASVCVLVAEAFNKIYELGCTRKRIMELAYLGETTTPSRCGKMDQACAYDKPILIEFDGNRVNVEELEIKKEIYLLIVDLKKGKDTVKILANLNEGFPWPRDEKEKQKHEYLGSINKQIVMASKKAIEDGNSMKVGMMMELGQEFFDEYLMPFCLEELEAPVLHSVLRMLDIQNYIYGGKGVGSGGDGTAQLVCKSKEDREIVKQILVSKGFECLDLDLKPSISNQKIKVIIPAGGFASRLYPLTENQPKSLLKINGKTLLDYTIDKINEIKYVDEIIIVTNNKFYNQFLEWKNSRAENIKLINNNINTDQELSSGLGNLLIAINNEEVDSDILVIGGDNFFECSLEEIYETFKKEQKDIAILYDVRDIERAKSLGVAKLKDNLIENFEEKPQNPKSTLCSTSAYFYKKETLNLIRELSQTSPHGNIGSVIEFLYKNVPVYGYVVREKWVDINDKTVLRNVDPETYRNLF